MKPRKILFGLFLVVGFYSFASHLFAYEVIGEEKYFKQIKDGKERQEGKPSEGTAVYYHYEVDEKNGAVTKKKNDWMRDGSLLGSHEFGCSAKIVENRDQYLLAVGLCEVGGRPGTISIAIGKDFINDATMTAEGHTMNVSHQKRIKYK